MGNSKTMKSIRGKNPARIIEGEAGWGARCRDLLIQIESDFFKTVFGWRNSQRTFKG